MGIDIRDGAQLECINCALCIDACDEIMVKVGRPTGLIAYDTDANMARRKKGVIPTFKIFRPRVIVYSSVLLIVAGILIATMTTRATMNVNILRDRTLPFIMLSDGSVRNAYTIKIVNRDNVERLFNIDVDGPEGMVLSAVGEEVGADGLQVSAAGDAVRSLRLFITMGPHALDADSAPITFRISDTKSGENATKASVFLSEGP